MSSTSKLGSPVPAGRDAEAPIDEPVERRNVRRLVRWVAAFVAWPSLSVAIAFVVAEGPGVHWLHLAMFVPLGLGALVVFALAPRLARRLVPA